MPSWLTALSWIAVALGSVTAVALAVEVSRHRQQMAIMNIVWPITGLYFPLVGFWLYAVMGRPMTRAAMKQAASGQHRWKSIFVSATHCGAGCVIGDLLGAPVAFAFGWTLFGESLFSDYAVEFALAYMLGMAFQYFAIRAMRNVSPLRAITDAIKADTLSLAAFEIGMFGWMAIVTFTIFPEQPPDPGMILFWFLMQIGMVLGFATTFPANWVLIRTGIKQAMSSPTLKRYGRPV